MEIIPYDPKYTEIFVYDGIEKAYLTDNEVRENIKYFASQGECYIGLEDSKPILFGGIIPIELPYGILQAWLYLNTEAYKREHIEGVLKFGKHLLWNSGFRRVQTLCLADNEKAETFLKHLGFEFEGRKRKLFKDRDMCEYSIIPKG